ncbi:MAG: imidazoleglycerol-phosphate dehydratase HisB [Holophaga sp.]|nr:imidazoleglycerol-phosphate dehydratase HisB [Holophaga sp.]
MRTATLERVTGETKVRVTLDLDGGPARIHTGLAFFDHMLMQLAKHGGLGLEVEAVGDLEVDGHHLVEDVGLCLGETLKEVLGDKAGIARFGEAHVPLDESLARVVVDLSGRPWCHYDVKLPALILGNGFHPELAREFFIAFAQRGAFDLHATILYGENTHHQLEALFKALAVALKRALKREGEGIPSTKGTLTK